MGQRRPDFDETLRDKIDPAAEIALQGTGRDADHGGNAGQDQSEQNGNPKPVDQPCDDIAALVIGAEPVPFEVAAGRMGFGRIEDLVGHRLALVILQPPCRRGGRGRRQVALVRAIGEADRRPEHEAMVFDLFGNHRVAVIGLGEKPAELFFRIIERDRKENLALVEGDNRPVVGDDFRKQRQHEQGDEDPERPIAAPVALEIVEAASVDRCEPQEAPVAQDRGERRGRRGGEFVAQGGSAHRQTSRVSKSMRGSIHV